jgi:hypothetical protein
MATIIKDPALVHKALPPKKPDNCVSLGLTNDCSKLEDTSLLRGGGNRVLLQTLVLLVQTPNPNSSNKQFYNISKSM